MRPLDPRLLRCVPQARGPIAALAVLAVVSGLAAIAQAFGVAYLVLAVVGSDAILSLPAAAALAVGAFATRGLANGATELIAARAGALVSCALRDQLLATQLARPAEQRQPAHKALTYATQGANAVEPYVARYLPTLFAAAVLPVATVIAMFTQDWATALIPVLTLPLLPLFAALIGASTAEATATQMRTLTTLSGHFLDVMRGLPTLVSYGRAYRQARVINTVSHDHRRATVATLRMAFLSSAALELLATLSVAIVAVWTGISLAHGTMQLHTALPLILLAPEAYWPIRRVGAEFHNAAEGANALATIADEITAPPAEGTHPDPTAAQVQLHEVSYRYGPDLPLVLHGLDAHFGRGLTVITGPSGAGKTTLLELIAHLREPSQGTVRAPGVHLVTQRPFLAAGSIRDNLTLGALAEISDAAIGAALAQVGLGELPARLPHGLDSPIGDDGFGLSAGQRARIALARALLSTAPVIALDEPTAHLDAEAEQQVHAVISALASTRIVIAVTHRDRLRALADREIELNPLPAVAR